MKKTAKKIQNLFTLDGYAIAPLWQQILILVLISFMIILIFGFFLRSFKDSYSLFFNPEALVQQGTFFSIFLGFFSVIFGIILGGFIISILSSSLIRFINNIQSGTNAYKKRDHYIIVHKNKKLFQILEEMDLKSKENFQYYNVAILVTDKNDVSKMILDLNSKSYPNLCITVKYGDSINPETYKRLNVTACKGIVILLDDNEKNIFNSDNINIQAVSAILSNKCIIETIIKKNFEVDPYKCIVEIHDHSRTKLILEKLQTHYGVQNTFVAISPEYFISRVVSRTIVDISYYKIFEEIFSFKGKEIYFVNPNKNKSLRLMDCNGMMFKDLYKSISTGILIGLSRVENGKIMTLLFPLEEKIGKDDWLIVLAENENKIFCTMMSNKIEDKLIFDKINKPSRIIRKNICVLGEKMNLIHALDYIDNEKTCPYEKHISRKDLLEYMDENFLRELESQNFDSIILNVEDQTSFKLVLLILSIFGKDSRIFKSLVIIIDDPRIEKLLYSVVDENQIILSERIVGNFYTQIAFQKNLYQVIEELSRPYGCDIFFVKVQDNDIIKNASKNFIKNLMLHNELLYIGIVDNNKQIILDADIFENASCFIVLGRCSSCFL